MFIYGLPRRGVVRPHETGTFAFITHKNFVLCLQKPSTFNYVPPELLTFIGSLQRYRVEYTCAFALPVLLWRKSIAIQLSGHYIIERSLYNERSV